MTTKTYCSIYERRPELCRNYPTVYHYVPPECTFWFAGDRRTGKCECNASVCCALPRENGEPEGKPMIGVSGGLPCKYLAYREEGKENG